MQSGGREERLGFVPVRFGDDVVGGAEMLIRELADGLAERGWGVDVLTGCTRDHFREVNAYEPGEHTLTNGARLLRFPSVASTTRANRVLGNRWLDRGKQLDTTTAYRWLNDDVRIPGLFEYLVDHAHEYRALVFAPYLYWSTVAGAVVAPERTVIVPCLHDEPTARLPVYERMFRDVRGLWFLTEPEAALARALRRDLAQSAVIGSGVAAPPSYAPERFRKRFGIDGPFVLYAGRRESAKAFGELVDWFVRAVERDGSSLTLVVAGPGAVHLPDAARTHVLDVGVLSTADRDDGMAAAAAVVQPSPYESFSRTTMEAWLAGTWVIANGASAVSRWHCERSGAGTVYRTEAEFARALADVAAGTVAGRAARGRTYVLREYTWPVVLDRVEALLDSWFPTVAGAGS
jgi:glycosyltransferase involved in cell wall biosynthesis